MGIQFRYLDKRETCPLCSGDSLASLRRDEEHKNLQPNKRHTVPSHARLVSVDPCFACCMSPVRLEVLNTTLTFIILLNDINSTNALLSENQTVWLQGMDVHNKQPRPMGKKCGLLKDYFEAWSLRVVSDVVSMTVSSEVGVHDLLGS